MSKYCQSLDPCKATCMDFGSSIPSSLEQPMTIIHRSTEREIMPFRHGMVISTYMNDYLPPLLSPGYMTHIPNISNDASGKTFGNATKKCFYDCRDIFTKSTRPRFVFGRLPTDTCVLSDVVMAERAIPWKKHADTPNIRPISFDMARFCEIQHLYQNAQDHRDYYLDETEKVYPVDFFNLGRPYLTRCPVDEREFKIREPFGRCDDPGYMGPMPYYNCRTLPCIQAQGLLVPLTNIVKLPRPPFVCDRVKPKKRNDYETLLV